MKWDERIQIFLRRRMQRTGAALCLTAVLVAALSGCSAGGGRSKDGPDIYKDAAGTGGSPAGQVLHLVMPAGTRMDGLAPETVRTDGERLILAQVYEGLTRFNSAGKVTTAAAGRVEPDEGKAVWTFTLRDDLRWDNGDPVTADDFKNAWLNRMAPDAAGSGLERFFLIRGARAYNAGTGERSAVGLEADGTVLTVTLERPFPGFDGWVTHSLFYPFRTAADGRALSNGAYLLSPSEKGAALTRSETYWDAANTRIRSVDIKWSDDPIAAYEMFSRGEVDLFGLPFYDIPLQRRESAARRPECLNFPTDTVDIIVPDPEVPLFADREIRRAMNDVLDLDFMSSAILFDASEPVAEHPQPDSAIKAAAAERFEAARLALGLTDWPSDAVTAVSPDDAVSYRLLVAAVKEWVAPFRLKTRVRKSTQLETGDRPDLIFETIRTGTGNPMDFIRLLAGRRDENVVAGRVRAALASDYEAEDILFMPETELALLLRERLPVFPLLCRACPILVSPRLKGLQVQPNGTVFIQDMVLN